jgi:hypothetical protein
VGRVTSDDILSRLSAGLDRDEQLARAIDDKQFDSGWSIISYPGAAGKTISPHIGHVHEVEAAEHIVRQDPARTLRRVEAIRKVIERYEFVTSHGPAVDNTRAMDMTTGATAALRDVLEMLASIYSDPAGEGE